MFINNASATTHNNKIIGKIGFNSKYTLLPHKNTAIRRYISNRLPENGKEVCILSIIRRPATQKRADAVTYAHKSTTFEFIDIFSRTGFPSLVKKIKRYSNIRITPPIIAKISKSLS